MDKQLINPPGHYDPLGWYTHAVRVRGGATIYVSGQVAYDAQRQLVGPDDLGDQAPFMRLLRGEIVFGQEDLQRTDVLDSGAAKANATS